MKTKKLLSIAILATLPFTVNADYVHTETPAHVPQNGTVYRAEEYGPYQIATISNNDGEHIASTAYVKGAYNDAIAAINTKQDELRAGSLAVDNVLVTGNDDNTLRYLRDSNSPNNQLFTAKAVLELVNARLDGVDGPVSWAIPESAQFMDYMIDEEEFDSPESTVASIAAVRTGILSQRVVARDTWGSNHTANVALITVVPDAD